MRKYLRSKAKHNMKLAGIAKPFKLLATGNSFFSTYWRKYAK